MQLSSWMNDRLPEMLWATLIVAAVERDYALGQFRRILNFIARHEKKGELHNLMHSGIAKLESELRRELIQFIVEPPETAAALATLRLFEGLPAREDWNEALPDIEPNIELLMDAVGSTLWHQSQEATDCRWLRVMAQVVAGRFHLPADFGDEWFKYPNLGDQREVRPSIRAAEIGHNPFEPPDLTWPRGFWEEAWVHTPCLALVDRPASVEIEQGVTRQSVSSAMEALEMHWEATHSTTAIDAKHDAIFGMAFYSLRILEEMLGIGIANSVLGRLGLRTIFEIRVNLKYLLTKDSPELWKKWREYGAGQAKLNALKFDDAIDPPKHIDIESIEAIAGEDMWEEFLTVNLAGWSGLDLRKLSEQSGLKESYDRHYSWTSGYSHGMWGPIRESCYRTCGNPLHRLHRYPERIALTDAVDDACLLVDEILEEVHVAYATFETRVTTKS